MALAVKKAGEWPGGGSTYLDDSLEKGHTLVVLVRHGLEREREREEKA